jgi:hypothetical protein
MSKRSQAVTCFPNGFKQTPLVTDVSGGLSDLSPGTSKPAAAVSAKQSTSTVPDIRESGVAIGSVTNHFSKYGLDLVDEYEPIVANCTRQQKESASVTSRSASPKQKVYYHQAA